jgi:tight adherence protein B
MPIQLILIIGGALAVVLLIVGVVVSATEEKSLVEERLGQYLEDESAKKAAASGQKSAPLTDWFNARTERLPLSAGFAKDLARADIKLKVGEYIAVMFIAASTVAMIAWIISGRSVIVAVVGAIGGFFIPRIYVGMMQGKRLIKFNDQLSDMLNLMVNGLRAGYSTMQAMESISKEMPSPISEEFRRVVQEMQLGVSMERALDNLLRRIPSPDLDLVVTALNVQREVGGNLAEILDTISHTIRERVRIKGEIRVLTSQVMYSGQFLAVMPILIFAALYLMNRTYFMGFFAPATRLIGIIALVLAVILIIAGYFVMTRIASIEV